LGVLNKKAVFFIKITRFLTKSPRFGYFPAFLEMTVSQIIPILAARFPYINLIAHMDIKQIQELVKLINKSNIGELSIEENDLKITIKQKREPAQHFSAPMPQAPLPQQSLPAPANLAPSVTKVEAPQSKSENAVTIKSPMIGTFYRQAGPGKPIFINVGDEVAVGQVVCIIEAMKLFNEIESEVAGIISKVLVEDASPVEFDQPLFLVEPA
jgi:acetyl-CoA carboxylase biotin carboxyl carrier protein